MAHPITLLGCALIFLVLRCAAAEVIEHTFHIHDMTVNRMCKEQVITTVNGSFPGPTIYAREGDTLAVRVINNSPYNITIHWHGVFQVLSSWADGPEYISHCPIRPEHSYTYRFNITGQEGTLLYHAHAGFLRATVHGALVIRPKADRSYPFPKPHEEVPIVIGEWFNVSVIELENQLKITGNGPNYSQGFTINGWLGDLYPCSSRRRFLDEPREGEFSTLKLPSDEAEVGRDIYTLKVTRGKTYLLRIINAALNVHMFFKIANHNMTVVAIDAFYTDPYPTDIIVLSPGQTVDALIVADQPSAHYYMATLSYHPVNSPRFSHTTATAILAYDDATTSTATSTPIMPHLPDYHDTPKAHKFLTSLTALVTGPFWSPVPQKIDEHMFLTIGLGIVKCPQKDKTLCQGPLNEFVAAGFNNVSFQLPKMAILEAYYNKVDGVFTEDFPDKPPYFFNFTNEDYRLDEAFIWTQRETKVKKLKYNATVEIILQSTALVAIESHPIHLHGFNFYVVAQEFGNFDPLKDREKFNLRNPQVRNTVTVPVGGWAAIRFQANNPGVWYMHCHLEAHSAIGLAVAFLVEDGPTPSTTLPPPPPDLPQC